MGFKDFLYKKESESKIYILGFHKVCQRRKLFSVSTAGLDYQE